MKQNMNTINLNNSSFPDFDICIENSFPSPCFIVSEEKLLDNLKILDGVQKKTGCKILLALKGFAMFSVFPLIKKTLHGVCASSPHEARLGREEFGGEVHAFAAAYSESDIRELVKYCDHIIFNSFNQWRKYQRLIEKSRRRIECGIRVNPEHREVEIELYDPCAEKSRLGVRRSQLEKESLDGISGLHFHNLCEKNADSLQRTLEAFEAKFADFIPKMQWINFGGGHHITREDYDVGLLCELIREFREKYGVDVYLEPGEAVALNAGVLVTTVLDVINNEMDIAILDVSAVCHMPDVLEMPYRPNIIGADLPGKKKHTFRLAGLSCLAGDIIGDYSFDKTLKPGDKLVFLDMAHYSMVKTTTFNGIKLPSIALIRKNKKFEVIREFGYNDFKSRLS